ncbi:hypothetical protein AB1L05_26285 [Cytobacillus horneckiae]|uniref:hypothetical protein n=1 Tax=Cytobacillus horneckiae TaxID=549687 RepID=UPI0039A1D05E
MTIRELSILKAALEGDIQRQGKSPNAHRKGFKMWLDDSKKLLRKVTLKLSEEEAKRFLKKTE